MKHGLHMQAADFTSDRCHAWPPAHVPESGGKDLFAHFSEIQGSGHKTLEENQRVSFVATQGQKGPQASNIQIL